VKKWTRWQDWAAVIGGAVAALTPLWATHSTSSMWLMIILGVVVAASGLVNLATPGAPWVEWVQLILGAALVLAPSFGTYTAHAGAAWTSWIAGAGIVVATLFALKPSAEAANMVVPSP